MLLFIFLRLVVKFMDAVRRVELGIHLKKRQSKLKSKMEELDSIRDQENLLLNRGNLFFNHNSEPICRTLIEIFKCALRVILTDIDLSEMVES